MSEQPYHKYVFDTKNRKFIGDFEKMYANEEKENFDSWQQEDINDLSKQVSLLLMSPHSFSSILDLGCGKGAFTRLLKNNKNKVLGVDISQTAVRKALAKYPD